ncbi:RNA-binding protein CP33, chloroplastic-like [Lotus japonicus]|uniref:RNA-binding protein CP33, chloroplastic-like n=1 Tax=Lotus japonicus TaxID=34305 RepID=UPI00258479E1|nr:RNA-binding protein CP33, chloroplastic-like [Lotus japonicus]
MLDPGSRRLTLSSRADATSVDGESDEQDVADENDGEDRVEGRSGSPSFTLFVDGISEPADYYQIRGLFGQIGGLLNVFVQKQKRIGRAFRFGFVRYSSLDVASMAINLFNGVLFGGSILSAALAKFQRTGRGDQRLDATTVLGSLVGTRYPRSDEGEL